MTPYTVHLPAPAKARNMRPWRSARDTARDFVFWLDLWRRILALFLRLAAPPVASLRAHPWLMFALTLPALAEEETHALHGARLRAAHLMCADLSRRLLFSAGKLADALAPTGKTSCGALFYSDPLSPELFFGFPGVAAVPLAPLLDIYTALIRAYIHPAASDTYPDLTALSSLTLTRAEDSAPPELDTLLRRAEEALCAKYDWDALSAALRRRNRSADAFATALTLNSAALTPALAGDIPWLYRHCVLSLPPCASPRRIERREAALLAALAAAHAENAPTAPAQAAAARRAVLICDTAALASGVAARLLRQENILVVAEMRACLSLAPVDERALYPSLAALMRVTRIDDTDFAAAVLRTVERVRADTVCCVPPGGELTLEKRGIFIYNVE